MKATHCVLRGFVGIGLAALICASAGCGRSGLYQVTGKLVYDDDGQPIKELAGETVTFSSEELGASSVGEVRADGTFTLMTMRPEDGVAPGTYKVTVSQPHPMPGRPTRGPVIVEVEYEDPATTPLEAVVEAKSRNEFTFKLKRISRRTGR
jgi:hypothetical protein